MLIFVNPPAVLAQRSGSARLGRQGRKKKAHTESLRPGQTALMVQSLQARIAPVSLRPWGCNLKKKKKSSLSTPTQAAEGTISLHYILWPDDCSTMTADVS